MVDSEFVSVLLSTSVEMDRCRDSHGSAAIYRDLFEASVLHSGRYADAYFPSARHLLGIHLLLPDAGLVLGDDGHQIAYAGPPHDLSILSRGGEILLRPLSLIQGHGDRRNPHGRNYPISHD